MNFKNIIFLLLVCLFSCDTDDCDFPNTPIAPAGFTINKIGLIEDVRPSQSAEYFQMINSTIGYAMQTDSEARQLFKTVDGGVTWTSSPIPYDVTLESLLFIDEQNAYLTHRGDDNGAFILKTTDGGASWEDLVFPEFPLHFRELQKDDSGNIYAFIGGYGEYAALVKSADAGNSWSEIYIPNSPWLSLLTIFEDKIYFKENGDILKIADLEGNILQSITIEGNEQISVIDEDNIIVVNQYEINKTTDGGTTWFKIFNDEARVIDFSAEDGVLFLLNKDFCGDNPNELSAFGHSDINSSTIEESDTMIDFEVLSLKKIQKIGEGHYLLQMFNDIFELKKL